MTPNSRGQIETARLVFEAEKVPMAPVAMHRYIEHRDANPKGLTAQELAPASIAAAEIKALWEWLCAQLQMNTAEHLQTGTDADLQSGGISQSRDSNGARLQKRKNARVHQGTGAQPPQAESVSDDAQLQVCTSAQADHGIEPATQADTAGQPSSGQ